MTAVRLLGQIDSPGSSRALALLALMSRSAEVRRNATQILRQRDPRDFAPVLIALFRDPIKYEVRPVNGPGSQGQLLVKQKDVNVKRLYSPLSDSQHSRVAGRLGFPGCQRPSRFDSRAGKIPDGFQSGTRKCL